MKYPPPRSAAMPLAALLGLSLLSPPHAHAGTVTLDNGDQLQGSITEQSEEGVILEHHALGTLRLDAQQIESVSYAEGDVGYLPPGETLNGWFFPTWDKSIEAGFNGSEGNTQNLSAYAAFNSLYEDEYHRWDIKANLFYAEDDGQNTRSEWQVGVVKDWLTPGDPLLYFATFKYEHDRFTGWEDRLSAFVGVGYKLIDTAEHELLARVGAGANYEFGEVNDLTPEVLLGLEGTWNIDADQTFTYYTTFFPALDPFFSEFRNVSGVAYKIALPTGRGLSLKLGAENEYNSDVAPDTKHSDFKYFGALVYDF